MSFVYDFWVLLLKVKGCPVLNVRFIRFPIAVKAQERNEKPPLNNGIIFDVYTLSANNVQLKSNANVN